MSRDSPSTRNAPLKAMIYAAPPRRRSCLPWCRSTTGWACSILLVGARFRARRVAIELAARRPNVADGRRFSRTRAEPAEGDPRIDGGKTVRKETASGTRAVTRVCSENPLFLRCTGRSIRHFPHEDFETWSGAVDLEDYRSYQIMFCALQ